jgi:hypothetical protein
MMRWRDGLLGDVGKAVWITDPMQLVECLIKSKFRPLL